MDDSDPPFQSSVSSIWIIAVLQYGDRIYCIVCVLLSLFLRPPFFYSVCNSLMNSLKVKSEVKSSRRAPRDQQSACMAFAIPSALCSSEQ
mmetsp:Transcript_7380/g.16114  ORF Transcript_7380/g.16114 Transcript_7380/m.16114 type:complete len:90 (-) Transcript_7380:55-324(-)